MKKAHILCNQSKISTNIQLEKSFSYPGEFVFLLVFGKKCGFFKTIPNCALTKEGGRAVYHAFLMVLVAVALQPHCVPYFSFLCLNLLYARDRPR
jgi:hypothetical protein